MKKAKLFTTGSSQAVRLPAEFRDRKRTSARSCDGGSDTFEADKISSEGWTTRPSHHLFRAAREPSSRSPRPMTGRFGGACDEQFFNVYRRSHDPP
jgi:hypothetical protein